MSHTKFSHSMLTMLLANRDKGSIGKFLDKLNEHTRSQEITQEQKDEILEHLEDFFIEEHKVFTTFSNKVEKVLGESIQKKK